MHPALEKRLRQLQAGMMHREGAALARREALRALVAVGGNIRRMLIERGVDPADVTALRRVDEAAAELGRLPEGAGEPDTRLGDTAAAADFIRKLVAMALLHYGDGERPDPAHASLMEWHAWCLVTPASPHDANILRDPDTMLYQRMLRLGCGASRWR